MAVRRYTRGLVLVLGFVVVSGPVQAHGVSGARFEAPLPLSLLLVGAGATVGLTAVWLARSDHAGWAGAARQVYTVPAAVASPVRTIARSLFLAVVAAVLVRGIVGPQAAADNAATVFTWPVWFGGIALLAMFVGSPWRVLSPWRTIYRGLCRLEGEPIAVLGEYPDRVGRWPAVIGFVVLLGVLENLTILPRSPRLTTAVVAGYALVMVSGAVLSGEAWLRRADPLGVLYRLLGRVSVVSVSRTEDGGYTIRLRPPWWGCLDPVAGTSLVVFVVGTVYTVSFDGFTATTHFQTVLGWTRDVLGLGAGAGIGLYLVGLLGFVAVFAGIVRVVERLGGGNEWVGAMQWFAPTILPIAAAYELAHAYPYVVRNLSRFFELVLEPVVPGLGPIDPLSWLSLPAFWGSQVGLIVLGHVIAVIAAHAVATSRYGTRARLGHLPLVVLMVGYTVLSLWIISQPVVA